MLDPINVLETEFEKSHLLLKMQKMIIACRMFEDVAETSSIFYGAGKFNLPCTSNNWIVWQNNICNLSSLPILTTLPILIFSKITIPLYKNFIINNFRLQPAFFSNKPIRYRVYTIFYISCIYII